MESNSATEPLKRDHRVIERVLDSLEVIAGQMARGDEVPVEALDEAVTFSQTFVDKCHHGKEELCLFPCLEKRGIPREGGPIGIMLHEHQVGRDLMKRVQDGLKRHEEDKTGGRELAALCSEYVSHLRQHIFKEESILFGMGDHVMGADDREGSLSCYERTEEGLGDGVHEKMLRLAQKAGALARKKPS